MQGGSVAESGAVTPHEQDGWASLIQHLRAAIYICDAQGYITHFNEEAASLWGRRPRLGVDRWCGSWRSYRSDGGEVPLEQCPMAVTVREQRPVRGEEMIIQRPDGVRRTVRMHAEPLYDAAGRLVGAVNLLVDISDYKVADFAQSWLAAIVRNSEDAIVSKDLDGVITSWNAGARQLFGYSAEEVVGKPVTILMPPERVNEEPEVLSRIRRGESVRHYETVRRRKDGSLVDISLTVSPIHDADGRIVGASKIARDISDRKRAEQALAEQDRRKDEFIATLAHELRNPLAPLKASLELLRKKGSGQVTADVLEMMERQVHHLTRLVEDLLDLSRIKHGTITLKKEAIDPAEAVRDALEVAQPLIESKRHRVELGLPAGLRVLGDRTRLVQIIANLLNNAAKFTPPQGSIRLSLRREGEQVQIRCADNGPGIRPEMQQAIFEMFTRAQTATAAAGMGIGLSLVRQLVQLHSGSVRVHSEGDGAGAEFIVSLPLAGDTAEAAEAAAPAAPGATAPAANRGRNILIADDNQDAASALGMLFKLLGHEVDIADSGEAALDRARRHRPDVAFLDIGLPDISGHEVAARLRQEPWGKSMLLIALTGWGEAADRERSSAAGFDHHFVKPVDMDSLVTLLEERPQLPHLGWARGGT